MPESINPIQLEIYRSLFFSIAEEMGSALRRTAYSTNIKERRDYSCALFDGEGELVAMGDHMPVHLGSMPLSVRAAIQAAPLFPGDVVALNDPYSGGTHLPDITLVAPVYQQSASARRPLFFAACRAHHSDIGGMTPGSMPLSSEIFQEGVIILPLKLYETGKLNQGLLQLLLHNVRTPLEREGDLAAQVGALRIGEKRLLDLVERNGRKEVKDYTRALQDYSERLVRGLISEIPDGEYESEDFLDDDGLPESSMGRPVKIRLKIIVEQDRMAIDFSGTDAQVKGSLNAVRAITLSAIYYALRCLAPSEVPSTAGLLRPVDVYAPENSVVNASYPSATAGGNVETSQRIVDVIFKALSLAVPQRIPAASSGTMNNLALGGIDPATKRPFSYYETIGGGMGADSSGGGDNGVHTHMTNSLNTPIEAFESAFPARVREYRLRSNSGGRGRHRGGDGIVRSLEMLTDVQATLLSERRKYAPYGLEGGRAGKKGMNFVSVRGRRKKLPGKASLKLSKGDILIVETPGGGGWGAPEQRRGAERQSGSAQRREMEQAAREAEEPAAEAPPSAAAAEESEAAAPQSRKGRSERKPRTRSKGEGRERRRGGRDRRGRATQEAPAERAEPESSEAESPAKLEALPGETLAGAAEEIPSPPEIPLPEPPMGAFPPAFEEYSEIPPPESPDAGTEPPPSAPGRDAYSEEAPTAPEPPAREASAEGSAPAERLPSDEAQPSAEDSSSREPDHSSQPALFGDFASHSGGGDPEKNE